MVEDKDIWIDNSSDPIKEETVTVQFHSPKPKKTKQEKPPPKRLKTE